MTGERHALENLCAENLAIDDRPEDAREHHCFRVEVGEHLQLVHGLLPVAQHRLELEKENPQLGVGWIGANQFLKPGQGLAQLSGADKLFGGHGKENVPCDRSRKARG